MSTLRITASSFGVAILASLSVLFVGLCVFGFQFAERPEWQGRILGLLGTIAGVAGTAIGLWIALRLGGAR